MYQPLGSYCPDLLSEGSSTLMLLLYSWSVTLQLILLLLCMLCHVVNPYFLPPVWGAPSTIWLLAYTPNISCQIFHSFSQSIPLSFHIHVWGYSPLWLLFQFGDRDEKGWVGSWQGRLRWAFSIMADLDIFDLCLVSWVSIRDGEQILDRKMKIKT